MKKLLYILLLLLPATIFGQGKVALRGAAGGAGTSDSSVYATKAWRQKGDDSLGAIKLSISDTNVISTKAYRKKGDDSLAALINLKVNISDSASMLANYLRGATAGFAVSLSGSQHKTWATDTTSGGVASYRRAKKIADSLGAIKLSLADSNVISTKAWRQKGDDSLGAILSAYLTADTGNYTPTLTNTTNVAASTAYQCWWFHIADRIYVFGEVSIDATSAATISEMGMSLPVSSNISVTLQLAGTGAFEDNTVIQIVGDVSNDRAKFRFTPVANTNNRYSFHFSYKYVAP